MIDPAFYSTRRGGLSLHELIAALEDDPPETACIYMAPPDEGEETDKDSDKSDEECDANINHLGAAMLRTECEAVLYKKTVPEFDSDDDVPLINYVGTQTRKKRKLSSARKPKLSWSSNLPNFALNTNCCPKSPPEELGSLTTPLEFFKLFFDQDVINNLLEQTNLYASQKNTILNLTENEIYVVFGALLLSGYAKYPNKRMYWSSESDVPKILADSIRLNRFEQILRNLHVNNNAQIDKDDRLFKLRPLITNLNDNFKKFGGLEENLSIDESMIPYYGKHYAKQFIKSKPIRFGFKNWALCTSNGYMLAFSIYMGKQSTSNNEYGIGGNVVLSLVEKAEIPPNLGYKLFFDNYFTSISLLEHLYDIGYCASGTVRENRLKNCPVQNKKEWTKLPRGSSTFKTSEKVLVVQWKDNKIVTGASNFSTPDSKSVSRYSRDAHTKITIPQPMLIHEYNRGMGGVDKLDNMVANYRTRMRQRKWWWPIFVYLFDSSVVNAWLLMQKFHPNHILCSNLLAFRRNMAVTLLKTYGVKSAKGKTAPQVAEVRFDGINHLVEYNQTDRRCGYCGKKANYICQKCDIGMHPKFCFTLYHTK